MHEFELKPSRRLGLLLAGMGLLALLATGLAALPPGARLALALGVIGLAGGTWWRARTAPRLRLGADGTLQSRDETGEWCDVDVSGDSFVSPALIVLRYRVAGGPSRSLTLLPDRANADDLRRLRVSLRWARRTRSDTSFPGGG